MGSGEARRNTPKQQLHLLLHISVVCLFVFITKGRTTNATWQAELYHLLQYVSLGSVKSQAQKIESILETLSQYNWELWSIKCLPFCVYGRVCRCNEMTSLYSVREGETKTQRSPGVHLFLSSLPKETVCPSTVQTFTQVTIKSIFICYCSLYYMV